MPSIQDNENFVNSNEENNPLKSGFDIKGEMPRSPDQLRAEARNLEKKAARAKTEKTKNRYTTAAIELYKQADELTSSKENIKEVVEICTEFKNYTNSNTTIIEAEKEVVILETIIEKHKTKPRNLSKRIRDQFGRILRIFTTFAMRVPEPKNEDTAAF